MKKRILSIVLTICMVVAMAPVMSTTALAADTCTCLVKCTDSYRDEDCPVCKTGGTGGTCTGRTPWPVNNTDGLQNAMNLSNQYPTLYFQLTADFTLTKNEIQVPENADVVLDLNGHTITAAEKASYIFIVSGKLTILDTQGGGRLKGATRYIFEIKGSGRVLMKGGIVEQTYTSPPG